MDGLFVNHAHLMPASFWEDGTRDVLLRLMNGCGIAQAVCFAPFFYQRADGCEWLAAEIVGNDWFLGYGTLDPERGPTDQVKRIADLGFRGIKLHPPARKYPLFGERARQAYAAMDAEGLVADFHLGVH